MINVGILGAKSPKAGEIIRILINHPDVTIRSLVDKDMAGYDVKSVHHGLIGECTLEFSSALDLSKIDAIFTTEASTSTTSVVSGDNEIRLIELGRPFAEVRKEDSLAVFGVPELNRKSLVRGTRHAVIPSALESVATVALLPLAMRDMLPDEFTLKVEASDNILEELPATIEAVSEELSRNGSKNFKINCEKQAADLGRVIRLSLDMNLPVPVANITDMYEELYEDHNLTFVVAEEVEPNEVEGTDKCIISIDKGPDGTLQLRAMADARMRGGAGDAVHVMNLLMGLFEKTGLSLKASQY
ncbi:MAG: hypothetical protein K2M14_04905 [Muribaculaceae bacterium]|nr:hypothetical protein [Muribaculaceae bacterium]